MTDIFGLLKGKPEDSDYEKKGVIVQGITGSYGSIHAKQMIAYGTNVVAGVTPNKGGQKFEETIPIYNTMQEAVDATNAKISIIFVQAKFFLSAAKDALNSARNQGLDLILINDKANPPLCRIVEMNKYLYEQKQKEKAEKKRQRENLTDQKEIRMGLNIDVHDLQTKANHAKKFLEQKAKVTVTIVLKGRERGKQDMARDLLNSFAELLEAEYETINSQNNRVIGRVK